MCTLATSYPNVGIPVANLCHSLLEALVIWNTAYLLGSLSEDDLKDRLQQIEPEIEVLMADHPGDWAVDIEDDPHAALLDAKEVCMLQLRRWAS